MSSTARSLFTDPTVFVRLRSRSVAWRRVVDDVVVLDTDAGQYHAVNASGAAIWERLAEGATVDALAQTLRSAFPAAADCASEDVRRFLDDLAASGLLEVGGPDAGTSNASRPGVAPPPTAPN